MAARHHSSATGARAQDIKDHGDHMLARTAFILTGLLSWGTQCLPAHASTTMPSTTVATASAQAPEMVLDSGQASWYGPRHVGLRTYNGERFDPSQMTAAHASLPMGTMVRVTDMNTGRSVIVRVNDREPPHGVRCIDLSEGAATALGMHGRGLADVTLTAVAASRAEETVEVAEASDGAEAAAGLDDQPRHVSARHGRQHRRHAVQ